MSQITIKTIYTASNAGAPMHEMDNVMAIAGVGLEQDRYALGLGAFSTTAIGKVRDITFISQLAINEANSVLTQMNEPVYDGSQTRRNIVLSNVDGQSLNELVGKKFWIGQALFEGTELCEPCKRPAKLLGRSVFMQAFENRGGIRAKVLQSGLLKIGAKLVVF